MGDRSLSGRGPQVAQKANGANARQLVRTEPRLTGSGTVPIVPRGRAETLKTRNGAVAQLGERRVRNAKVRGSIPLGSTNDHKYLGIQRDISELRLATNSNHPQRTPRGYPSRWAMIACIRLARCSDIVNPEPPNSTHI